MTAREGEETSPSLIAVLDPARSTDDYDRLKHENYPIPQHRREANPLGQTQTPLLISSYLSPLEGIYLKYVRILTQIFPHDGGSLAAIFTCCLLLAVHC
jgi:hypothetical protein